jgi:predicted nucleotidyltransferase
MQEIIAKKLDKITTLCETHKVTIMFAIGSVLTNDFKNESDIDL